MIPTCYLLDQLNALEENKDRDFYFAVGADLVNGLRTWDDGDRFVEECNFLIMNRTGYTYEAKNVPKSSVIVDNILEINISSTLVRKRIKSNISKPSLGIVSLVLPSVIQLIKKHKLYH